MLKGKKQAKKDRAKTVVVEAGLEEPPPPPFPPAEEEVVVNPSGDLSEDSGYHS